MRHIAASEVFAPRDTPLSSEHIDSKVSDTIEHLDKSRDKAQVIFYFLFATLLFVALLGCQACTSGSETSSQISAEQSAEGEGEAFISAMMPYLDYLGKETVNNSISIPDELIENSDKIVFCGIEGTVSHKFNEINPNSVSICDWESNIRVDEARYDEAVEALRGYYGQDGRAGTSEPTPEFGSFNYIEWDDPETDGNITIFLNDGILHVRWWLNDSSNSTANTSSSSSSPDNNPSSDNSISSRDHSSNNESADAGDGDYQHLYDSETGIYGVYNGEDNSGLFAGDDFAMRLNEDGTGVATDGKGNWVADTDGDGEIDSISVDGGETWY